MTRRIGRILGVLIVSLSILTLLIPLSFAFGPLLAKLIGVSAMTFSADEAAIRLIALSGIGGGMGLVVGIWLMVSTRTPPKPSPSEPTRVG